MKEEILVQFWRSKMLRGRELVTTGGEALQIIHPGRVNGGGGPDFHHAIIAIEGKGLVKGDVEVHVRSSQWRSHGHHRDPAYNGVVLHVVMWHDEGMVTVLQNGNTVPVLPLHPYLELSPMEMEGFPLPFAEYDEPCHNLPARLGVAAVRKLLEEAGEERFRLKAAHFGQELAAKEGDQVLYEGLMGALGYSRNKETFQELARRLPLRVLQGIARGESSHRRGLVLEQALLSGAGLAPSSPGIKPLCEAEWHLSGVRPRNRPQLRIAGAGYLLARYIERGLASGVLELVGGADPKRGYRSLEQGMLVTVDGANSALIGRGRAREMVVNVVLPFSFAWGERESQPELRDRALELYRNYPELEENQITRQMRRQLLAEEGTVVVDSARRQQGLIHIYYSLCLAGDCLNCPLGEVSDEEKPWASFGPAQGGDFLGQPEVGGYIEVPACAVARFEVKVAAAGDHGCVVGAEEGAGKQDG